MSGIMKSILTIVCDSVKLGSEGCAVWGILSTGKNMEMVLSVADRNMFGGCIIEEI